MYAPADVTDDEVAAAVHSAVVSRLRWIKDLYASYEFSREPRQFLGNCVIKELMMANSFPEYQNVATGKTQKMNWKRCFVN